MANVIVYYAHPGHRHSHANRAMQREAQKVTGITMVDLYADYPRFEIDPDKEQQRLLDHDIIVFQFPLFWYSTPSLLKEWQDLVLEHGFAFGHGGDKLVGKSLMLAVTAAGPKDAYTPDGYQNHQMREFLVPMEQTATLCKMHFLPPYVLYGSLRVESDGFLSHAKGFAQVLAALRDDVLTPSSPKVPFLTAETLTLQKEA
ncbi:MAG: NAD(P)H-dependent oxidoreductase [Pseudoruegeria sp.]